MSDGQPGSSGSNSDEKDKPLEVILNDAYFSGI